MTYDVASIIVLLSNSTSGCVRLLSSRILTRFTSLLATVPVINRLEYRDLARSSQTKLIESWVTLKISNNGEKFSETSDLIYIIN